MKRRKIVVPVLYCSWILDSIIIPYWILVQTLAGFRTTVYPSASKTTLVSVPCVPSMCFNVRHNMFNSVNLLNSVKSAKIHCYTVSAWSRSMDIDLMRDLAFFVETKFETNDTRLTPSSVYCLLTSAVGFAARPQAPLIFRFLKRHKS